MGKAKSGGGIQSRQVRQVGIRYGGPNRKVNPAGADQLGQHLGDHAGDTRGDTGKGNPASPLYGGMALPGAKLGNEVAKNVGAGGPGTGRTVYKTSTQGMHGSARGPERDVPDAPTMRPGRDILGEYGKDWKGGGRS
jgi:hypothetical protein